MLNPSIFLQSEWPFLQQDWKVGDYVSGPLLYNYQTERSPTHSMNMSTKKLVNTELRRHASKFIVALPQPAQMGKWKSFRIIVDTLEE